LRIRGLDFGARDRGLAGVGDVAVDGALEELSARVVRVEES
jgi:hypothetical protein